MGAINNRNDYRYFAAFADIKEIGAETPPMLHEDTPRPIGTVSEFPAFASVGQWVVWNGATDGGLVKGDIYVWDGQYWMHKAPDDAAVQWMYMQSLTEILRIVPGEVGRFSYVITNLLMAQEIVVGKLFRTSNFNGRIDDNGQILDYGTEGVAITKAGKSVITDGFFRGMIDCGVMKVSRDDIYQLKAHYTTSQAEAFVNYYRALAGASGSIYNDAFDIDTTVPSLFGANNYIALNNGARYNGRIRLQAINTRTSGFSAMVIYPNGQEVSIGGWSYGLGQPLSYVMNYDYKQSYEITGAAVLDFATLPTSDPHISGRAYVSSGILKVSQG